MTRAIFALLIVVESAVFGQAPSYTVGWRGGVEVLFTPDAEPLLGGDLLGGTLSLHSAEGTTLITFGSIRMTNLHHVASLGTIQTPLSTDHFYGPHQAEFDSHLLITLDMLGGSAGDQLQETGVDDPDAANPAGVQDRISGDVFGFAAATYQGDINNGNGAFFLLPELQTNAIDFARLVGTPGTTSKISFVAYGSRARDPQFEIDMNWTEWRAPPEVTVDVPPFVEAGTTVLLSPSISDLDDAATSVKFYDNGHLLPGCSFTSAPYLCEWTPTMSRYEDHEVRVLATDEAGNSKLSRSQLTTVFTQEPQVRLWGLNADNVNFGAGFRVRLDAQDPDGIALVEFLANGQPIPSCDNQSTCTWTPAAYGRHTLQARVHDTKGFVADSEVFHVSVVEPYSIKLAEPPRWNPFGEPVQLTADVSGSVRLVEFLAGNEPIPNCQFTAAPYACEWTPMNLGSFVPVTARVTNETGSTRESTHKVRVGSHFSLTNPDGVSLVTDRVLRIGESIRLSASGRTNEYGTISFYANDELIPNCSFDAQASPPWTRFGCEWIPQEGDYTITVVGVEAEGKERFISPKTQLISVIPMGAVGLGEALPVDEDGVPILVTDFEDLSCLGCDESVITRPSRILHWPKIPVGAGGRISLVEFVELEDESEAFDAIKFRDHKLPILYDAMPNSFVTLDRFVFDSNLAAGDYSATYQLVFDDGTVIRTKLNASINSESSDLVPEPTGLTSFLIVLLIMLVYRQSPATCHSGQTSYYSHESRATRTH